MIRFTDGKKLVELEMLVWDDGSASYSPDISANYFKFDSYNQSLGAYLVSDADHCIAMAEAWAEGKGPNPSADPDNSYVFSRQIGIRFMTNGNQMLYATAGIFGAITNADMLCQMLTGESNEDLLLDMLEGCQAYFCKCLEEGMSEEDIDKLLIPSIWEETCDYVQYLWENV